MESAFENSPRTFTFDAKSLKNMDKMPRLKKDERYADIIRKGLVLLSERQDYRQVDVLAKLETLGKPVSRTSLSNVVTGTRSVGLSVMRKASDGLEEIIRSELGMAYDPDARSFFFRRRFWLAALHYSCSFHCNTGNAVCHDLF